MKDNTRKRMPTAGTKTISCQKIRLYRFLSIACRYIAYWFGVSGYCTQSAQFSEVGERSKRLRVRHPIHGRFSENKRRP